MSSRNHALIDASARFVSDRFDLGPGKSVCDLGCGPGLYAARFVETGASVMGMDFSATSLANARGQAAKVGQSIPRRGATSLELEEIEKFDLITLIMCDFYAIRSGAVCWSVFTRH